MPVFYFSNPAGVIGHEAEVWAPRGSQALDYELELACVIGREARDLPDDDRALEAVAGFTIMNDWSARDLQRIEMAVGLGPSKGKDFATSLGPELVSVDELAGLLSRRPVPPGNDRHGQWPLVIARKLGFDVLDVAPVAGPCQPRRHACGPATCSARERSAPAAFSS